MNNTPELLSPAGDLDKMRFGIAYGADAVYMAGTRFGMRAAATNFDDNALREGIAYAHAHGVKCYITVNIMPSNRDLPAWYQDHLVLYKPMCCKQNQTPFP